LRVRDQEFTSDVNSRPVKRIEDVVRLRASQFSEDGGPMAHAVGGRARGRGACCWTGKWWASDACYRLHALLGCQLLQRSACLALPPPGPTHPTRTPPRPAQVRPDSYIKMDNFYTVTVYEKGSEVVRLYATLLGKEGFRWGRAGHRGLRAPSRWHAYCRLPLGAPHAAAACSRVRTSTHPAQPSP
jgi:hypothetical protein